ncbi:type IV pilus secretin PilQ [Neisseria leonii]|uniref:type IV pilus secretin PilQ n=1 Tax=Neisseria leonii TaxID=2995413 RepID=UPI00237C21A9|nr:type IV pilus secretin PilQ [Neisseria sp. 3986]MDD9325125.1 type IV pilus secretin PilQ [Neisseria sp. 3986]
MSKSLTLLILILLCCRTVDARSPADPSDSLFPARLTVTAAPQGGTLIELAAPNLPAPDIRRQGRRLSVRLPGYTLPPLDLPQNYRGTPIEHIRREQHTDGSILTATLRGGWQFDSQATPDRIRLLIRPSERPHAPADHTGKLISLDFQNIDVRTLLQIIAKESGMNIVASDAVNGKMTISLKNLPWPQALDVVLQARSLHMSRSGNVIHIRPKAAYLADSKAELALENELQQQLPLRSRTFRLQYKNAEELAKMLKSDGKQSSGLLSPRGSILADSGGNSLVVHDTEAVLSRIDALIQELDRAADQVMIEVKIVEANDGFSRELGAKFGYSGRRGHNSWGSSLQQLADTAAAVPVFSPNVSLPAMASAGSIALVHAAASSALGLELSAQQAQSRAKIISSPRILTRNRQAALIESGTEIPYQEATSSGATSTGFKKAVLGLNVLPAITPDGHIIMDIKVNKDTPTACGASEPCVSTKRLQTSAMVENGGTLVLGGIYEENSGDRIQKVPLLGDIPLLGHLFSSRARNQERKELLVFITPHIVGRPGFLPQNMPPLPE